MKHLYALVFLQLVAYFAFAQNPLLLKDIYPGTTGSSPTEIVRTSGYTFFNAEDDDADADKGLYRTDGTPGGTIRLNLTYPTYISSIATRLTPLGNKIVFAGDNLSKYGEIWVSDGTQPGTIAIERFQPTTYNAPPVVELKAMGSYVYYSVVDNANHALLKKTDGTIAGTSLVYDFSAFSGTPQVVFLTPHKNLLYFIVYDAGGTGYDQLWRSDGTPAGTYVVYNWGATRFVQGFLMPAGDYLYCMIGDYSSPRKNYLWRSDGTQAGTIELKQIGTSVSGANNIYPPYAAIGSTLYFAGLDATYGKELWKTDGTAAGTTRLSDLAAGAGNSNPRLLKVMNNQLFFVADNDTTGAELWKYNGSAVSLVKDIFPGVGGSAITALAVNDSRLVFNATSNSSTGNELWVSDGTSAGTVLAADINPGSANSSPSTITDGIPAYFVATTAATGAEMYKFDPYNTNTTHKFYVNDGNTAGDVFTTATGNNSNTGTITAPFASMQVAANIAAAGDTIYVDAGNYSEQVTLLKGITIIGAGATKTHLSRPDSLYAPPGNFTEKGLIQTGQNIGDVHISHMHITGDYLASPGLTPIIIQSGGSVKNCKLEMGNQGVYFRVENKNTIATIENCGIQAQYIAINVAGNNLASKILNNELTVSDPGFATTVFAGLGFGPLPSLEIRNNSISGFITQGIQMNSANPTITQNSFNGQGTLILQLNDTVLTQATCNWWGSNITDSIAPRLSGAFNFKPFLNNGLDSDTSAIGFQPMPNSCNAGGKKWYVNDNSTLGDRLTTGPGFNGQPGTIDAPFPSIVNAMNAAAQGDTILVDVGVYSHGTLAINKPVTLLGANYDIAPNKPGNPLDPNDLRMGESEIQSSTFQVITSNVYVKGFAFYNPSTAALTTGSQPVTDLLLENNYFAAGNVNLLFLIGPGVSDTSKPRAGNFFLVNNRFDKITTGSASTVYANYISNLTATKNTFKLSAATPRTQTAFAIGQTGVVSNLNVTDNYFDQTNYDVFSSKLQNGSFINNKSYHSGRALLLQSTISTPSKFVITGNQLEATGVAPKFVMNQFETDSIFKNSPKYVDISNNDISIDATGSTVGQNPISVGFYTPGSQSTFICKNNKVLLTGSFAAQSSSIMVQGIGVAGRVKEIIIDSNELINNGTNMINVPKTDTAQQLVHPGIYIYNDNGTISQMADGSLEITHNIVHGFKQSVVFYDATTSPEPYKGYGNNKGGYRANINYNSFTGDSISINNGPIGQIVNANCNWYGTTDLTVIGNKISKSTVRYTPILTSGDQSANRGFQPAANSCMSIVDFVPSEGNVGLVVQLKGAGFSGVTQVAFNGTSANFSVNNDSTIIATVPQGASTGTLMISKTGASIVSVQNFMVLPEPSADSVGICPGSNSLLVTNILGNTYQWQIQTDTGVVNIVNGPNFSGAASDSLRLLNVPTEWNGRQIRCQVNGGSYSKTFTLKVVNYWTGNGNDNNWNNPLNWGCSGQVPDINTSVVISAGEVLLSGDIQAKSIWATPGTSVFVQPGTSITIKP